MFDLKDKTVIITGGIGLIGSEFSRACADENANLVIVDISEERGNEFVSKLKEETGNQNIIFQKCDITKVEDINKLTERAVKEFGKIDALVNGAYPRNKNYGRKFEDVSYEDFCENVNLHLGGYFLITKLVSEVMKKQNHGNIVNIASMHGYTAPRFDIYEGTPMTSPVEYSAIKGGLINMTRYMASYLGKYNIRVNAISPGGVFDNQPESFVKKYCERVLLGKRMTNPDDLSGVLLFLLSDASKYMTGQNIPVEGGFTL